MLNSYGSLTQTNKQTTPTYHNCVSVFSPHLSQLRFGVFLIEKAQWEMKLSEWRYKRMISHKRFLKLATCYCAKGHLWLWATHQEALQQCAGNEQLYQEVVIKIKKLNGHRILLLNCRVPLILQHCSGGLRLFAIARHVSLLFMT